MRLLPLLAATEVRLYPFLAAREVALYPFLVEVALYPFLVAHEVRSYPLSKEERRSGGGGRGAWGEDKPTAGCTGDGVTGDGGTVLLDGSGAQT